MIDAYRHSLKLVLVAVSIALLAASPAQAGGCGQAVIDDWADNGVVNGSYPAGCYGDAIDNLPEDLAAYSSAADDIAGARGDELGGGGGGGSSSGGSSSSGDGSSTAGEGTQQEGAKSESKSEGAGGSGNGKRETPDGSRGETSGAASANEPTETIVAAPSAEAADRQLGDTGGSGLPLGVILAVSVIGAGIAVAAVLYGGSYARRRSLD